jgi:hypothetical protein
MSEISKTSRLNEFKKQKQKQKKPQTFNTFPTSPLHHEPQIHVHSLSSGLSTAKTASV